MNHVREGTAWSAVVIDTNFTDDLFKRICSIAAEECKNISVPLLTEDIIDQSTVHLHSDVSSKYQPVCFIKCIARVPAGYFKMVSTSLEGGLVQ